ncbi:agmatine deiminase family protein [Companilactobacillus jidongensis]|uniref:agmatine deiminase family protein n=1 Tax=Companilactobacillus jidongensis TaxID=2486006 RepID=UPI000F79D194|nr:agmatine deiminase family protein [Companilactobacillus jidongensis]
MTKTIITAFLCFATLLGMDTINIQADTIYTSQPDSEDKYYQPFEDSFNQFNEDLQLNSNENTITSLSMEPKKFNTVNYYYPDIWIRDVAPVITTRMVKFDYSPSYLKKSDSRYLNRQFKKFLRGRYNYSNSKLKLDGGNVQWNGSDTVVVTKQILTDNSKWSKKEIIAELKYQLKVKHVIIISKEPGDVLGHSDGMVKFISARKMYINDFSYEPGFLKKIKNQILSIEPKMKFVVLPSSYTDKGQYDKKIASARGLYINMLETTSTIYFPQYGLKNDMRAMKIVQSNTNKKVVPVDVSEISTLGGSVHCLTWEVPNKFNK